MATTEPDIEPADQSTPTRIKLDPHNRVVLPRAIRDQADIAPGTEFTVIVEGRGRITLATPEAITAELHAMFAHVREEDPRPAEEIIRDQREHDAFAEEEKWADIDAGR